MDMCGRGHHASRIFYEFLPEARSFPALASLNCPCPSLAPKGEAVNGASPTRPTAPAPAQLRQLGED